MPNKKLVSLTFDDGFEKSGRNLAAIFGEFGLKTSLSIIARGAEPGFGSPDEWHNAPRGGWELWNELAARGHEIQPHGLDHTDPKKFPAEENARRVDRCIEIFREKLKGFDPNRAVYECPYNSVTPEFEALLSGKFRAYRPGGNPVNPLPSKATKRVNCWSDGPGNADASTDRLMTSFLESAGEGWLVLGLHGLDEEGWGPISSEYLKRLLDRLLTAKAEVLPPGEALDKYGK